ncbi:hypothetical protein BDN72DRAFT_897603 [Pluteus cervinus]|uniref:Uncharacterized protein n=1 Tax=Pluteus cervinus TaxID=181527 RepID=A0ACD3AU28_9AGAR|nr:hypothetical protein BDN72DRAFT_897603 [Pluteus cervinus]
MIQQQSSIVCPLSAFTTTPQPQPPTPTPTQPTHNALVVFIPNRLYLHQRPPPPPPPPTPTHPRSTFPFCAPHKRDHLRVFFLHPGGRHLVGRGDTIVTQSTLPPPHPRIHGVPNIPVKASLRFRIPSSSLSIYIASRSNTRPHTRLTSPRVPPSLPPFTPPPPPSHPPVDPPTTASPLLSSRSHRPVICYPSVVFFFASISVSVSLSLSHTHLVSYIIIIIPHPIIIHHHAYALRPYLT